MNALIKALDLQDYEIVEFIDYLHLEANLFYVAVLWTQLVTYLNTAILSM